MLSYSTSNIQLRARAEQERRRREPADQVLAWKPYPGGPQEAAHKSEADILGYGGEAGGGKSDLLIGTAGEHHRAVIFRREFPRLRALIDRSREIFNADEQSAGKDSYNESLHLWRLRGRRQIEFGSIQREDNKLSHQGRPRDFYGFDEVTEFSESQVRFVIGWNRSTWIDPRTKKPQRCRVVFTFNPPMTAEGEWVITFFLPWLAYLYPEQYQHPNPAKPGELRWFATVAGKDEEIAEADLQWYVEEGAKFWQVESGDAFQENGVWRVPVRGLIRDGELLRCKSRTFIPASLKDNPILQSTGYAATVDAMPEPYRSLLKGGWGAGKVENPWQLIPTAWVRAAEKRRKERTKPTGRPTGVGADIARGGKDRMSIAKLYGNYLDDIDIYPGIDVTNGPKAAALLLPYVNDPLGVDVISIGSSPYDSLKANDVDVMGINFSESAPEHLTTRSGLKFYNVRAAAYWKLREAFDPEHGDSLAIPDDSELREELTAARFEVTSRGIKIEPKEDIIDRIGRSPDKADALALAYYTLICTPPEVEPEPSYPTVSYR